MASLASRCTAAPPADLMAPRNRISEGEIELAPGRMVPFELHRVVRRRHVHLLVNEAGVVQLRAPWRYPVTMANELVASHAEWLIGQLARVERQRQRRPALVDGAILPLFDEQLRLRVDLDCQLDLAWQSELRERVVGRGRVERRDRTLLVKAPRPGQDAVRELLVAWYRRTARPLLLERLGRLAETVGTRPKQVRIAAQRSRWGSCSSGGTISLNWRLVLLPGELADYVLVHELCHLTHLDHSARFWGLVESVIPNYRQRREQVRSQENCLAL